MADQWLGTKLLASGEVLKGLRALGELSDHFNDGGTYDDVCRMQFAAIANLLWSLTPVPPADPRMWRFRGDSGPVDTTE